MSYIIKPINSIKTEIHIPADKSISHRAAILASLSSSKTKIYPFLLSDDTKATLDCLKRLAVELDLKKSSLTLRGNGLFYRVKGSVDLDANQSGTTIRILSGLLSAQKFSTYFNAASSLLNRPMSRITVPLRLMGADIYGRKEGSEEYPPIIINPVKELNAIEYKLPIASAQVKSAIMLAALFAKGITKIYEPIVSRDHTERMLKIFGVDLIKKNKLIVVKPIEQLISPKSIFIPSDFSSAAFFIVLGLITKNSQILLKNININPTRCGLLKVLKRMGAKIKILNKINSYEPYADIFVKSSELSATAISKEEVPTLIDEIPIFCVAASFAKGTSTIYGVSELKLKESDRVTAIVENLRKVGVDVRIKETVTAKKVEIALKITGRQDLSKNSGKDFISFSDHRIAMSFIVLAKALSSESSIDDISCINKSFPEFITLVESL